MPYVAQDYERYKNKLIADGSDVEFVYVAANAPASSTWRRGVKVQNNHAVLIGTAIATFKSGHFTMGQSGDWAVIFLTQDSSGLRVLGQEAGHPVAELTIPWHGSVGGDNGGDQFYVIE